MTSHTLEAAGLRMRWEVHGDGPPVVFIHGIPTSPALWRHVVPRVTRGRCLAWEMVGYGASIPEGRGRDLSIGRQADYLIDWMDALGLEQAVLVGHDLGGGVAQIAAVRYRTRVRGLVLMNAVSYDSWPVPGVKLLRALGPLVERLPDAFAFLVLGVLFFRGHDDFGRMQEALATHWPPYARVDAPAALIRQMQALDVNDTLAVADALPHLGLPARIVWGAADQFQKLAYGRRLARALNAPLDRIDEGKHFVPEDYSDRVADAVNGLLAELEETPA